jgi:hypothetical protein
MFVHPPDRIRSIGVRAALWQWHGVLRGASLVLIALFAFALAACKTQPSPWSPEVDKLYHLMSGRIFDGG